MYGPEILARSLSQPTVPDKFGNTWQYHPRSDRHSKILCWAILFDLLVHCTLLADHAKADKIGFGINHQMQDFKTKRKKDLDLVVCRPGTAQRGKGSSADNFRALTTKYGIVLNQAEQDAVNDHPDLRSIPVGMVHLALEAKAAMTAHIRALPRLHDELNSSHLAIHGAADFAIAAGFAIVNLAPSFVSPDRNKHDLAKQAAVVSRHNQPGDTLRTIKKVEEIPRRTQQGHEGFDALGIIVLEMRNDGSPVSIIADPPAPPPNDLFHYDALIRRIAASYENRFGGI